MDFNGLNMASATSAVKVAEIAAQTKEMARKAGIENQRKEAREQENHDNNSGQNYRHHHGQPLRQEADLRRIS